MQGTSQSATALAVDSCANPRCGRPRDAGRRVRLGFFELGAERAIDEVVDVKAIDLLG